MVCRATSYSGEEVTNYREKNWNGDVQFAPAKFARPNNLSSLIDVVARATEDNQPLHVIGSRWSFEDCASSDGVMVSLDSLTKRLSYLVDDNRQLLALRFFHSNGLRIPIHTRSLTSLCKRCKFNTMGPSLSGPHRVTTQSSIRNATSRTAATRRSDSGTTRR